MYYDESFLKLGVPDSLININKITRFGVSNSYYVFVTREQSDTFSLERDCCPHEEKPSASGNS